MVFDMVEYGWMISWYNLDRWNHQQTAGLYECSKLLYGGVEFGGVVLRQAEQLPLQNSTLAHWHTAFFCEGKIKLFRKSKGAEHQLLISAAQAQPDRRGGTASLPESAEQKRVEKRSKE